MPLVQKAVSAAQEAPEASLVLLGLALLMPLAYRAYAHPLAHIPGPLLARITPLWLYTICYLGIECRVITYYHRKLNTSILRVAPHSISISDGAAIQTIYVAGGGLPKDVRYSNFDLGPIKTIFSSLDPKYRDARAKAVLPLFAPNRIRAASIAGSSGTIARSIDEFIALFRRKREEAKERPVDILDLSARLSIDVVSGFLFHKKWGGLAEPPEASAQTGSHAGKLSITPFILSIVAFSRFSLLPQHLFTLLFNLSQWWSATPAMNASAVRVDEFVNKLVEEATNENHSSPAVTAKKEQEAGINETYQSRLLAAGISPGETAAQCTAVLFAGTDSTALMLATILFHLVQNQDVLLRLKEEAKESNSDSATTDLQTLPCLRAVVREGLRLGMANPARFTRVVPPGSAGLDVAGVHIPPGTTVGVAPYTLHHDPERFPEPFAFRPERWLNSRKAELADLRDAAAAGGVPADYWDRGRDTIIPFGVGPRTCLARNLATYQLYATVKSVAESGVLEGASTCDDRIRLIEWFNAEIEGHKLEIKWR